MNFQVIEAKRKKERITVTELCDKVGIDRSTYYKMLRDPDRTKVSTWQKIADELQMTPEERIDSLA